MRLYKLEAKPPEELPEGVRNPWEEWEVNFGAVIRANTKDEARLMMAERAADEGKGPWLDERYTTCKILRDSGESEVIMIEGRNG